MFQIIRNKFLSTSVVPSTSVVSCNACKTSGKYRKPRDKKVKLLRKQKMNFEDSREILNCLNKFWDCLPPINLSAAFLQKNCLPKLQRKRI
jgi:hypothetical protein